MYFWWCPCYFLSLLMKLMTRMTKWAVTIQGSGDSQGWARLLCWPSANTVSCKQERQSKKKKKNLKKDSFFQGEVGKKDRGRETSDGRRMHMVKG